jgi:hypothetical protein
MNLLAIHSMLWQVSFLALGRKKAQTDNRSVSSDDKSQDFAASSDTFSSKGKKKSSMSQQQDHYALPRLGKLRYLATEDQIQKSCHDMPLKHHPDKHASLILNKMTEEAKKAKDEIEERDTAYLCGWSSATVSAYVPAFAHPSPRVVAPPPFCQVEREKKGERRERGRD